MPRPPTDRGHRVKNNILPFTLQRMKPDRRPWLTDVLVVTTTFALVVLLVIVFNAIFGHR